MASTEVTRGLGPWALATILLASAVGGGGCVHRRGLVTGRITPEHFQFKTIVPVDSSEMQPDGWRAVCIHARITEARMNEVTQESLVGIARQYYPTGFPVEEEDLSEAVPAHHRTPEHERFMGAWEKAQHWPEWKQLMKELPGAFPGYGIGGGTQPFVSACMRCFVYREEPLPGEERFVTRVAAAVSVLARLYVVYVTTQIWRSTYTPYFSSRDNLPSGEVKGTETFRLYHSSRPELAFAPPSAFKPAADTLARLIEQVLGYRRFPLEFARVPLPDLRVGFFNGEGPPTLLDALFSDNLANLP